MGPGLCLFPKTSRNYKVVLNLCNTCPAPSPWLGAEWAGNNTQVPPASWKGLTAHVTDFPNCCLRICLLTSLHLGANVRVIRSVMSDSSQPHGQYPTILFCPRNSPSKNTRVGSLSLLQGIFPTHRLKTGLPHCRQILDWATREAPWPQNGIAGSYSSPRLTFFEESPYGLPCWLHQFTFSTMFPYLHIFDNICFLLVEELELTSSPENTKI